jgi:hypothetical protein
MPLITTMLNSLLESCVFSVQERNQKWLDGWDYASIKSRHIPCVCISGRMGLMGAMAWIWTGKGPPGIKHRKVSVLPDQVHARFRDPMDGYCSPIRPRDPVTPPARRTAVVDGDGDGSGRQSLRLSPWMVLETARGCQPELARQRIGRAVQVPCQLVHTQRSRSSAGGVLFRDRFPGRAARRGARSGRELGRPPAILLWCCCSSTARSLACAAWWPGWDTAAPWCGELCVHASGGN